MKDKDDNKDIKITDHTTKDGQDVKLVEIKSPYAVPTIRGIITPAALAFLTIGIFGTFLWPGTATLFAVGNGIAALGWFWLYKISSTVAAKYFNRLTLQRAVYAAELDMMQQYVAGIVKKNEGNLSKENLSNKESEGKLEAGPEPE